MKRNTIAHKAFVKVASLLFVVVALVGLTASSINYFEVNKQLDIFAQLFREVNTNYVDNTEPGELMDDAITNMLKNLDPYTVYIPENDIENYRMMQTGKYGGIGATIMKYGDYAVVSSPKKDFPADKAGLVSGDMIKAVSGKSMKGKSTDQISDLLKGSPGTKVELTYERNGKEQTITIERAEIVMKSVPYYGMLNNETGYIVLTSFTQSASKEITDAFNELKKNEGFNNLVLDLRGNPGGLLSEAINVSNIFIEKGEVVVATKGRTEQTNSVYRTLRNKITDMPVVVLISGRSASASEIVAGTLQDLDRGVVLGQQSYGKGLVQQTKPLSYGSQVKITIAKYYTPSGRCIQAINYAERDADGNVKRLPDSLRQSFRTANGREVLDGAGVDPDVVLKGEVYPKVLLSLIKHQHIFNWVNDYKEEHSEITAAGEFHLTDKEYQKFVAYLSNKDYHYITETEKSIIKLKERAESESFNELNGEIKNLENALEGAKRDELAKHKDHIKHYLEVQIAERYYYDEGRIKQKINNDPEVKEAYMLLSKPAEYKNILSVEE